MAEKTREEEAYATLKALILENGLPVGEFLSQRKLAERVGAAVVTVRSCLRRLENEGLVESVPKWGVRIPEDTVAKVRDRYFMREILEVAAVEKLIEERNECFKERLLLLADQCDSLERGTDESVNEFSAKHMELHLLIAESSGSPLLVDTIKNLNLRSMMLMNARRGWAREQSTPDRHHRGLVETIFQFDLDRARRAIREHIRIGLNYELEALDHE